MQLGTACVVAATCTKNVNVLKDGRTVEICTNFPQDLSLLSIFFPHHACLGAQSPAVRSAVQSASPSSPSTAQSAVL